MAKILLVFVFLSPCFGSPIIDGTGPGWRPLGKPDFIGVNCPLETWTWKDGQLHCSGTPEGIIASSQEFQNFELSFSWSHQEAGGDAGLIVWAPAADLKTLANREPEQKSPSGVRAQMMDPAHRSIFELNSGGSADWFTCHGDLYPLGKTTMTLFPPLSPDGTRSFPSANTTKPSPSWNHYYLRAINGEVRLWVNGTEVSGGNGTSPSSGHLCFEAKGSPFLLRDLKVRELP